MFKHDHHTNQETLCPGGSPPRPNLSTTSMTIFRTSLPCLRPPAGPWRSVRHQKHGSDPSPDAFYLEPLVEEGRRMLAELRPYSAHAPRFELFAGPDQALLLAERATPL